MRTAIAITCFFLSGVAGLVYEVCWIRTASLVFGSTIFAVSTVLAVFFLGLALGSYLFGRIAQKTSRPLRLFAWIEFAVGALALASPAAFGLADSLYGAAYRAAEGQVALLVLARLGLVCLVLLPPTLLMGGTLPLFCRQFVVSPSRIARSVGGLYGINTLGAALGCAATGLLLLPRLGVHGSIAVGASLNLLVAVATGFLGLRARPLFPDSQAAPAPAASRGGAVVAVLLFLTGFVALGNEVLWTRHLALLIRNTVYTYVFTLSAVLVGIVLGSIFAAARFDRSSLRPFWFGLLQVVGGLLVLALMLIPAGLWQRLAPLPLSTYFFLLLPPAVLSGASFPLGVRMALEDPSLAGIGVGRLAAMNTLGGIAGSLTVGFFLLPSLGHHSSLLFTTGVSLAAGFAAWIWLDRSSSPRLRASWLAGSLLVWLVLPGASGTRLPADFLIRGGEILVGYREGLASNLAVLERRDGTRVLEIDRLWQGSDRKNQQALAAHVPMLLHPHPRRVLLVGVGAGQTASRFLMYDVERLDCVDIEPAVFGVIRDYFDSAWMDDERVRLIQEDGRNYLSHGRASYDVISIEVGQISRPGVPLFYTTEFYHRARKRLRPGGFLSQFVPIPFFTPEQFRSVLATFLDAFPQSFLWYNRSELLVIGVNAAQLRLDGARLELLSQESPVGGDLHFEFWGGPRHSLHQRSVFLGSFLAGPRGLAALAAGAPLYRDDRPVLDYATADVPREETREIPVASLLRGHLEPVEDVIDLELGAAERAAMREIRERNLGDLATHALLRRASVLSAALSPDETIALLEQAVRQNPENFAANLWLAEALVRRGRLEEARGYYAHALGLRTQDPRARRGLRRLLERLGRSE